MPSCAAALCPPLTNHNHQAIAFDFFHGETPHSKVGVFTLSAYVSANWAARLTADTPQGM
jgi:hypothetical protein